MMQRTAAAVKALTEVRDREWASNGAAAAHAITSYMRHVKLEGGGDVTAVGVPSDGLVELQILCTNDTHSKMEPYTLPAKMGWAEPLGGVPRRSTVVKQMRAEVAATLLLDAGDLFTGCVQLLPKISPVLARACPACSLPL
jgi:2',3'-cyclic-nucleotide 2'-phosphodiesterase (5'-nucleotidase family)